jgi:hypothetical protein
MSGQMDTTFLAQFKSLHHRKIMGVVELEFIRSSLSNSTDESFGLHEIVFNILKANTLCCKFLSAGCNLRISVLKVLMITLDPTYSILSLLL